MSNYYRSISKSIGDRERIGGGGTGGRRENGGSGSSKRAGRAGEMENDDFFSVTDALEMLFDSQLASSETSEPTIKQIE